MIPVLPHRRFRTWARALVALPLLAGAWPGRLLPQGPPGPTQNVLAGSRVFGATGCVRCHAINGLGGTVGPDLGESQGRQSLYDFAAAMWNHLPTMAERMHTLGIERPRLDPWEMGDLIAFLFWLDYFDPPGDTAKGKDLFTDKACVTCHQIGGVGGVVGPNLDFLRQFGSPIEIAAAMWNHGPAMAAMMQASRVRRPTFTGAELTDLITYLKSTSTQPPEGPVYVLPGRADEGRRRFVEKHCVECHRVGGVGGTLAPNLGQTQQHRSVIEFAAAMWNKAPAMTTAMRAKGIEIPQLRADDMADIVAYLYSVQYFGTSGTAARGRQLIRAKGCLGCHSLSGSGARTAGDLAEAKGLDQPVAMVAAMWRHLEIAPDLTQPPARPWPTLDAGQMADLAAFFQQAERSR